MKNNFHSIHVGPLGYFLLQVCITSLCLLEFTEKLNNPFSVEDTRPHIKKCNESQLMTEMMI